MSWPTVKLGDVITQLRGVTYSSGDAVDSPKEGYVELLRANNIHDGEINFNNVIYIPKSKVSDKQYLKENDILIAASSGSINLVGKAGAVRQTRHCSFGAFCKVIRPSNKVDARYIANFFQTAYYRKKISSLAEGANINNLRSEHIDNLLIPLPPLAEQKRIAAILDKAELVKRKRELAIEKLDLLSESIFEKIENSKEFLDFPVVKLGDIMELQRGGSPRPIADWITEEKDGINWIKISDATASDKYIYKCKQKIKKGGDKHSRMVYEGDFLLSNSMSFGRPYILKTSGCIHDGWLVLRDAKNLFEQDYLYSVLSSPSVKRQFIKFASGAVVKNLNIDAVSKVEIRLLDKQSQLIFSRKVGVIEIYKKQLKDADALLGKLNGSLQQIAFSGQL